MSWLVRSDVEGGRDELNFSDWDEFGDDAHDAAEAVEDGSMPPQQYEWMHPDARLSDEEEAQLIAALEAMDEGEDSSGRGGEDDDDGRRRRRRRRVNQSASARPAAKPAKAATTPTVTESPT